MLGSWVRFPAESQIIKIMYIFVYKDENGHVIRKNVSDKSIKINKITPIGVYETGIHRNKLMGFGKCSSSPIFPYKK